MVDKKKVLNVVAEAAKQVAYSSTQTASYFVFHQPAVPMSVKQMKKNK